MSTAIGRAAEDRAADYLKKNGYKIIARNWRTRWCEVDIVAQKQNTIYFVEVKYRSNNHWGDGLEYITPRKLQQMNYAAEFWIASNRATGDYCLSAIALSADPPEVTDWLEQI